MKLGQPATLNSDFEDPPLPDDWPASGPQPLTIDITGGQEQSWWDANKAWALPAGFVALFMLANR